MRRIEKGGEGRAEARAAIGAVLLVASATIAGALASQHLYGLQPCELCLWQRWPYYVGIPVALATLLVGGRRAGLVLGAAALGAIFGASALLGAYHAGVEWGLFPGPSGCSGAVPPASAASMQDFLRSLEATRVVSCTDAAWRWLGLSLAGWNALVSAGLAALSAFAARRAARPQAAPA